MNEATWFKQAEAWCAADPDPSTRRQLSQWLQQADLERIREHFATPLEFGTAGMRAVLGPGPARMNRLWVRQVAQGLADHLRATQPDAGSRVVVVGSDARHKSAEFRQDAAGVLAAAGFPVRCFAEPIPTPLVAFAARAWNAAAAVVITASHNPPEYNGIKVYGASGQQVVPPQDAAISAAIAAVSLQPTCDPESSLLVDAPRDLPALYDAAVAQSRRLPDLPLDLRVAYTAMHGVGGVHVVRLLQRHGVDVRPVAAQQMPDPDFPSVRFPNPEEPGALDLALATAEEIQAELLLANDPDADRLAVAVRTASGMRLLSGNELGALLGEYLLRHHRWPDRPLVVTTIVSSRLLSRIAARYGAFYAETLTGFKWIADLAARHEAEHGSRFLLGYEEALGYTVDRTVADKDGIATALLVCEMAAWCKSEGRNLLAFLQEIERREGEHRSRLHSLNLSGTEGAARIQAILAGLRHNPPRRIGTAAVLRVRDYSVGLDGLPAADVLGFELDGGGRVLVRPSGTEPKIKFYFELCSAPGAHLDATTLDELVNAFLEQLP